MPQPILYTFRRCPYAIRARMALAYSKINAQHIEVNLKDKPEELLLASSKGTVPVLILTTGEVIDESMEIIYWALNQADPDEWFHEELRAQGMELIATNDQLFKPILDRYKYAQNIDERLHYRYEALPYLNHLNTLLNKNRYVLKEEISFADIALFPFIRQFCMVDKEWFEQSEYVHLKDWLQDFLDSELFLSIMHPA